MNYSEISQIALLAKAASESHQFAWNGSSPGAKDLIQDPIAAVRPSGHKAGVTFTTQVEGGENEDKEYTGKAEGAGTEPLYANDKVRAGTGDGAQVGQDIIDEGT